MHIYNKIYIVITLRVDINVDTYIYLEAQNYFIHDDVA